MLKRVTFTELLEAAYAGKHLQAPGQGRPTACQVWRDAEPDDARLLEAAFAWELSLDRIAKPDDETVVQERQAAMDQATAATKAKTTTA
jgi:hypothetical protein